MKILHQSGKPYDLYVNTSLELTRYNPFFHDQGEQSIPISLPASDYNLALLEHPETTSGKKKIAQRLNATIQSGVFSINARQAIHSVRKNESIETSFYLREGAFYERIKDVSLVEIFQNKSIEFNSIDAAIDFMHSLISNNDERFACFEVVTDNYVLNEAANTVTSTGFKDFVKRKETVETIDNSEITVPKGFYITPFIKVKHLLEEVLNYFGYTLAPSFLDNAPFKDMCFLNNNIDTIVSNRIDYISIIPNIDVSTFFEVLRKFNLELIPDEQSQVLKLIFFDDVVNSTTVEYLDNSLEGNYTVNYENEYQQIKLSSDRLAMPATISPFSSRTIKREYSTGQTSDQGVSFSSLTAQYPSAYLREVDGALVRDGVKGDRMFTSIVGSLSLDYFEGGELQVYEKSFPDVIPPIFTRIVRDIPDTYLYVGQGRALYSSILMADDLEEDLENESVDHTDLKPMLAFCYKDSIGKFDYGTITNYNKQGEKLWDYSLMYNGECGIFEKFWRNRDALSRNALRTVEADLLLLEQQKFTLSTINKVSLDGQHMFLSELSYTPESESLCSCTLLTTKLQEPVSEAKTIAEYDLERLYKWRVGKALSWTWPGGRPSGSYGYKFKTNTVAFYPLDPTETQYNKGGKYYLRTYEVEYGEFSPRDNNFTKFGDGTITVWLEPELA